MLVVISNASFDCIFLPRASLGITAAAADGNCCQFFFSYFDKLSLCFGSLY